MIVVVSGEWRSGRMKPRYQEQLPVMSAWGTGLWRSCSLHGSLRNHYHHDHDARVYKVVCKVIMSEHGSFSRTWFPLNLLSPLPCKFLIETLTKTIEQKGFWKACFSVLDGRILESSEEPCTITYLILVELFIV